MEENKETAILVGIDYNRDPETVKRHLDELEALAGTIGIITLDKIIAPLKSPSPRFLVGTGKAEEIRLTAENHDADFIIFDDELSPSQQRNWETFTMRQTADRQEIIINIFSDRAATKEASLQVELAQLSYSLPRLTGAWTHFSKQKGGVSGTRGEGEKQLELDRRMILHRINKLKKELKSVEKQRSTQRKLRKNRKTASCSIAGYTNAGKSTLLNRLTLSDVDANNRVFDTLDPATRKMKLPGGKEVLLTDTVGFIRKLPHQLVEAFKSTLEETVLSDLIILLMDGSDPEVLSHYTTSMEVLSEIGAAEKPILKVVNKTDSESDPFLRHRLESEFENAVFISAQTGENIDLFLQKIEDILKSGEKILRLEIPLEKYSLIAKIKSTGTVYKEEYLDNSVFIEASVPESLAGKLNQYSIENVL